FIKTCQRLARDTVIYKRLHGFDCPLQRGSVDLVEPDIAISMVECCRLQAASIIQRRINSTSLDDTLQVEISLTVANEVYFFAYQFRLNLASRVLACAFCKRRAKITELLHCQTQHHDLRCPSSTRESLFNT